ncbi:hypothetical protein ACWGH2_29265 [Streptomyces sp. NPDC054871]
MARLEQRLNGRSIADVVTHELASYVRVSPEVHRAVVRYDIVQAKIDRLSSLDVRDMTPAQFDGLVEAQIELTALRVQLAEADALHLVEVQS